MSLVSQYRKAMESPVSISTESTFLLNPRFTRPYDSPHYTMNHEQRRLETFGPWPDEMSFLPIQFARAGFFYTGRDRIVQCFACGVRITNWSPSDTHVMYQHQKMSPYCRFIRDPSEPIYDPVCGPTQAESMIEHPRVLFDEQGRLNSFRHWPIPHIISPIDLAKAGFYYSNHVGKVKCAYCYGVIPVWKAGDEPADVHRRNFPECPFFRSIRQTVRVNDNLNRDSESSEPEEASASAADGSLLSVRNMTRDNLTDLGVMTHKPPKNSLYVSYDSRIVSFATWPVDLIQTPDVLAAAGFFYEGSGDYVRCFHCDGGLRHWDPHDEPWTEHAKWFPKCEYVQLSKGIDFVKACSNSDTTQPPELPNNVQQVSEEDVLAQMQSHDVATALSLGIPVGRIKRAITQKLKRSGVGFSSVDEIIEASIDAQFEEEDGSFDSDVEDLSDVFAAVLSLQQGSQTEPESENATTDLATNSESTSKPSPPAPPAKLPDDVIAAHAKIAKEIELKWALSLEEENRLLKEARLCKICMDKEVCIVFLPCGHLATCVDCASNLQTCPVCRSSIKATVRTYLS